MSADSSLSLCSPHGEVDRDGKPAQRHGHGERSRRFGAPATVEVPASLGLIQACGWTNGPGMIWTTEGDAAYQALADGLNV